MHVCVWTETKLSEVSKVTLPLEEFKLLQYTCIFSTHFYFTKIASEVGFSNSQNDFFSIRKV